MIDKIKKYGDRLIFALALTILAAGLVRYIAGSIGAVNKEEEVPPVVLVFSHWRQNFFDNDVPSKDALAELMREFEIAEGAEGAEIAVVVGIAEVAEVAEDAEVVGIAGIAEVAEDAEDVEGAGVVGIVADVIGVDMLWVSELIERGVVDDEWQFSDPVPLLSYMNLLFYNVDILTQAGFVMPPRNRTEFLNYARAVSVENSRWGIGMALGSYRGIYDDIFPWLWAAGSVLVNDNRPAVNVRQVIDSLTFLADLNNEGLIAPGFFNACSSQKLDDFISGRTVFMIASERDIRYVREHMGDEAFSVTSIPVPDNYAGRSFSSASEWTVAVNPASENIEEARLFANFLFENTPLLAERTGTVSSGFSPRPGDDPHYSKVWDIAITAEMANDFKGLPWVPLEEIFREELIALFAGDATPASTTAAVQRRWLVVLDGGI